MRIYKLIQISHNFLSAIKFYQVDAQSNILCYWKY